MNFFLSLVRVFARLVRPVSGGADGTLGSPPSSQGLFVHDGAALSPHSKDTFGNQLMLALGGMASLGVKLMDASVGMMKENKEPYIKTNCWRILLTASIWVLAAQCAIASPSFDCTKALASVEKLVCLDQELSNLDSSLAAVYATKHGNLGEVEAQVLLHDQRKWLAQRSEDCHVATSLSGLPQAAIGTEVDCLKDHYRSRLAKLDTVAPQQKVSDTDFHPDFWGIDLIKTFPQLRPQLNTFNLRPEVASVFADADGNIIVRIAVPQSAQTSALVKFRSYDISLFDQNISPVSVQMEGGLGGGSAPPGWTRIYKYPDIIGEMNIKDGNILYRYNASSKFCHDPLSYYIFLEDRIEKKEVGMATLVRKEHSSSGFEIGGDMCEPETPLHKVKTAALATTVGVVPLKDGTFLVWPNPWTSDLIRLDRGLHTIYRSSQMIVLDRKQRKSLPNAQGLDAVQKYLLSIF